MEASASSGSVIILRVLPSHLLLFVIFWGSSSTLCRSQGGTQMQCPDLKFKGTIRFQGKEPPELHLEEEHMGGCNNYDPILGHCYNTAPII